MKNLWILTLTILLTSAFFSACGFKLGENTSAKSDSVKKDEEKTERAERKGKKNKEKTEKQVAKNEEESAEDGAPSDAPDPNSNALSGAERPEGESKSISNALGTKNNTALNNNWLYVYERSKGYGFYVPDSTTGEWGKVNQVDTFAGATPNGIGIYVFAWKDRQATRETLLENAGTILEGLGETVKTGEIVGASDNFAVAEAVSVDGQGVKSKMKILVATDITDNYVMIVGCDEKQFAAKKATIDQIWGSFEMWSGGSGGGR